MTRPALRWPVAVLVTIAAFTAATWICGALVLTMRDAGVRWGIAGGLGVAVAALAALWGHSYVTAEHQQREPGTTPAPPSHTGRSINKISGGTFHGPVIQGRDIAIHRNLTGPAAGEPEKVPPPTADTPPARD